jgi:FKBP-type peptidyl-prolyl cis-trans isomerase SlyD
MSDEQQADADDSPDDGDVPDDETNAHDDAEGASDDVAEGASDDVAEETPDDVVEDGDFVRLAYTLRTADDGEVVDTTDAEVAEDAEIDTDEYEFEPRIIVIGAGHVFESVDEALIGQAVGATGTVEVSAAEAFGEYDDDQVRTVSANKIDEENRYPGAQVQIDGDQGRIITVVSGRARVDFNHPLAGEDLDYEYEILDLVDDREEQAGSLLGMYLQQSPEVWIETDVVEEEQVVEVDDEEGEVETELEVVESEKETLYIEATPQMTMNQQWMFSKQQIAQDVMDRLDLDRVIVQETIDGSGGMMGGLGGMMGGGPGGAAPEDIEDAIEDVDVDADELAEELDADIEE